MSYIPFPNLSPDIFSIPLGPMTLTLRWYALAYMAGLLYGWWIILRAIRTPRLWAGDPPLTAEQVERLFTWAVVGVQSSTTTSTTIAPTSTTTTTTVGGGGSSTTSTTVGGGSTTTSSTVAGATTTTAVGSGAGVTTTIRSSGGGQLAATGGSPLPIVFWAVLLLVFGRMAILLGRPLRVLPHGS